MEITEVEEDYLHVSMTIEDKHDVSPEEKLKVCTVQGQWEQVEELYSSYPELCSTVIKESIGTALHVAVSGANENVVRNLVSSIIKHNKMEALKCKNERGDTPLHVAASRGFKDKCECIIGNGERKHLIDIGNYNGESPLFLAALFWKKQTFLYLLNYFYGQRKYMRYAARDVDVHSAKFLFNYLKGLIRNDGDSILHCAIRKDFFDLALIIVNYFPELVNIVNEHGFSPLKVLATRRSAFKSGSKMIWWKRIVYHCLPVETLDLYEAVEYNGMKRYEPSFHNNYPENYNTCYLFLRKCLEFFSPPAYRMWDLELGESTKSELVKDIKQPASKSSQLLPQNYATCLWFLKASFYQKTMLLVFGFLAVFGFSGVEKITKIKQKHTWSGQLLKKLMACETYLAIGTKQTQYVSGSDLIMSKQGDSNIGDHSSKKHTRDPKIEILISETPILTAARNGIVEIMIELLTTIPHSIYEVNLENKNVLHVAVENRRSIVVEEIRKWSEECNKNEIYDNLIQGVDKEDNTVLHLAATSGDQDWNISGAALKIMWHFKWFQYIKGLVPEDYTVRTNKSDKTAGELYSQSYSSLIQDGGAWFKDTSESCSVVAALLAGVSFATSSTIPGGNNSETGKPTLEGRPAFDVFALSSVIGLSFSVTSLIMFLSILTSRKEAKDFRIDLPRKLLLGLSFLFLSIVAMITAFCSGNYFVLDHKFKHFVFLIYAYTCFPVTLYAVAQLPLYTDLLRGIVTRVPETGDKGEDL